MKQIGRELRVRYVLEGSVRKAGGRVRITAQLIEAETGTHLWADRFDGSLDAIFDLQDQRLHIILLLPRVGCPKRAEIKIVSCRIGPWPFHCSQEFCGPQWRRRRGGALEGTAAQRHGRGDKG